MTGEYDISLRDEIDLELTLCIVSLSLSTLAAHFAKSVSLILRQLQPLAIAKTIQSIRICASSKGLQASQKEVLFSVPIGLGQKIAPLNLLQHFIILSKFLVKVVRLAQPGKSNFL